MKQTGLRFYSEPSVRPGWNHVRSLPRPLLDVLRRDAHRQGRRQDAHPKVLRHTGVQRKSPQHGSWLHRRRPRRRTEAGGAL